ncbi:MAG: PilZ domain-containing protein [Myxococcales bacterium]|nr:PilZ domain-containing protein [Myxococcales bacterium]
MTDQPNSDLDPSEELLELVRVSGEYDARIDDSVSGRVTNLSRTGFFVSTEQALELKQNLKLSIDLEGVRIEVEARVTWLAPGEGAGVELTRIGNAHRAHLEQFLRSRVRELKRSAREQPK